MSDASEEANVRLDVVDKFYDDLDTLIDDAFEKDKISYGELEIAFVKMNDKILQQKITLMKNKRWATRTLQVVWEVNGMNVDKMGICVSIIVLVAVLGVVGILSGDFDLGVDEIKLPQINAGTNTNIGQQDGFYDYCYRMGLDC